MMFGSREPFTYNECAACGSLSIAEVPANLGDYYPPTYYSFAIEHRPRVGYLPRRLAVFAFLNMPRALADRLPADASMWRAMNRASVSYGTRVLDVGCGNGALLVALQRCGFTDLAGVDPFIPQGSEQE
ncbi:MAG: hypothetical protein QOJ81_464, partial [Chloroflexota bacterium]|nr:hypothetical protein [Chloroflexota bacterium]